MAALTDEAVPPDAGRAKKREDLRSCFCNIVDSLSADDLDLFHSLVLAKPPSSTSTPSITSTGSASEAPLRVKPTFLARLGLEPASPLENSSEPSAPLSSYRSFLTEHSAALDRIIEDLRGIIPTTQHVVGQSVESEGEAGGYVSRWSISLTVLLSILSTRVYRLLTGFRIAQIKSADMVRCSLTRRRGLEGHG